MTNTITIRPLSKTQRELLQHINEVTGLEEFVLYGGASVDLILKPNEPVQDLDIAYPKNSVKKLVQTKEHLISKGYKITNSFRKYTINKRVPVSLLYAENDNHKLDIAFLDDLGEIGQFNIGSVIWRYPEMELVDKFQAFDSIKRKLIKPIRSLDTENPTLLLRCFIKLASKYNINLLKGENQKLCLKILHRLKAQSNGDKQKGIDSLHSAFLGAVLGSRNPEMFLDMLSEQGLLGYISTTVNQIMNTSNKLVIKREISKSKTKDSLLDSFKTLATEEQKFILNKEFRSFTERAWESKS